MPEHYGVWIDGCGGFRLVSDRSVTFGGASARDAERIPRADRSSEHPPDGRTRADVEVITDWPAVVGEIRLRDSEHWWTPVGGPSSLLGDSDAISAPGSARMTFHRPSRLSATSVLRLDPPHRFVDHFDALVLVDRTVLVGPTPDCHLRSDLIATTFVLIHHPDGWKIKTLRSRHSPKSPDEKAIRLGSRFLLETSDQRASDDHARQGQTGRLAMTLERLPS